MRNSVDPEIQMLINNPGKIYDSEVVQKMRELFKRIAAKSSEPVVFLDFKHNLYVMVNEAYLSVRKRTRQEMFQLSVIEPPNAPLYQPEGDTSMDRALGFLKKLREEGSFSTKWINYDGDGMKKAKLAFGIKIDERYDGLCVLVGADITQEELMEKELRKSQDRFYTVFENSMVGIFITDLSGKFIDCNPAGLEILGYSYEEILNINAITVFKDPKQREELVSLLMENIPVKNREFDILCKDGSEKILSASVVPMYEDGLIDTLYTYVIDITEKRQTEMALEKSIQELNHSQKMESMGRFAGGIAHDLNNILTVIKGYSEYLLDDRNSSREEIRGFIQEIADAAKISSSLIQQLVTFSKKQIIKPEVRSINNLIMDTTKLIERFIGENIKINVDLDTSAQQINIDPVQFSQIIINLTVNARDAMPKGGILSFQTKQEKEYVKLIISDTGVGMDEETVSQIFEPYFTTKSDGSGLGLSMVYGIVQQNNGTINVNSTKNVGTEFLIRFPNFSGKKIEPNYVSIAQVKQEYVNQKYYIFVLEDSNAVRNYIQYILEQVGHSVTVCENPITAINMVKNKKFDLIISDVIMPDMNGLEFIKLILEERPNQKVLFITGYLEQPLLNEITNQDFPILEKPFSHIELITKIKETLS